VMSIESELSAKPKKGSCIGCRDSFYGDINEEGYCLGCFVDGVPGYDKRQNAMVAQVDSLTEALNTLLESVKLCRDCNVHLDSLNDAVDNADKVLEGKG